MEDKKLNDIVDIYGDIDGAQQSGSHQVNGSSSSDLQNSSEWFPLHLAGFLSQECEFSQGEKDTKKTSVIHYTFTLPWSGQYHTDRQRYVSFSLKEKRKLYSCGDDYVTLDQIPTWAEELVYRKPTEGELECNTNEYPPDPAINQKVSHWHGDITRLEIDAITNATIHTHMLRYYPDGSPGTVRYAMEQAAGPLLTQECHKLKDSVPGDAMVTFGYNLPAKLVIHSATWFADPDESDIILEMCYKNCLQATLLHNMTSIAFCCIGTGELEFPQKTAAHIALKTIRGFLDVHGEKMERVIFCTYTREDWDIYRDLLPHYFPPADGDLTTDFCTIL